MKKNVDNYYSEALGFEREKIIRNFLLGPFNYRTFLELCHLIGKSERRIFLSNDQEILAAFLKKYWDNNQVDFLKNYLNIKTKVRFLLGKNTFEGTVIRLLELEEVKKELFIAQAECVILGGSLSYGPFFNIRHNGTNNSDIDILVVMPDDIESFLKPLSQQRKFNVKRKIFDTFISNDNFDILSTKIPNPENYYTSFHFFKKTAFDKLLDIEKISWLAALRDRPFKHRPLVEKGMDNEEDEIPTKLSIVKPTDSKQIKFYVLTILTNKPNSSNYFTPNIYHNFLLPNFTYWLNDSHNELQSKIKRFKERTKTIYEKDNCSGVYCIHKRHERISPSLSKFLI